jgi:hypothetical protein
MGDKEHKHDVSDASKAARPKAIGAKENAEAQNSSSNIIPSFASR